MNSRRRLGAVAGIVGGAVALLVAVISLVDDFPRGLLVLACVIGALACAWLGLLRRGTRRIVGFSLAVVLLGVAVVLLITGGHLLELALIVAAFAIGVGGTRVAFATHVHLPSVPAPERPFLFINPRSGGGKAAKFNLAAEATSRGYETVELEPGDDLETLVREGIAKGADALAMAGGDGSQAIVAAIAAELELPYACIPSGTRNHFALDLGVDREDVVGALEAFVDGGEKRVDLAEVNGRTFVNNASLGVYAEAVSREGYREAKMRTLLDTLPDALGPDGDGLELRWRDPTGVDHRSTALVLVSNNAYLLGLAVGSGTRPRMDEGLLGVVELRPPDGSPTAVEAPWQELTAPTLEVDCDRPVPIGVDGESLTLDPPLRFKSRPGALRVRIAHRHPGASPSANAPRGPVAGLLALMRLAGTGGK
jgi:hypothetical protein